MAATVGTTATVAKQPQSEMVPSCIASGVVFVLLVATTCFGSTDGGRFSRHQLAEGSENSLTTGTGVPCTCAIFLSGQFNRYNRTEQPNGNPGIQLELLQHFPCTPMGNKLCSNKCLDLIVKHLPNSQNVICATIDRDCFRERAYLFFQNCVPRWINSNISAGREYCCESDKPMRCSLMEELIRQSLHQQQQQQSASEGSTIATTTTMENADNESG